MHVIRWEYYLTTIGESEESFLCLLLSVMRKANYLSNSDRCHMVRYWQLRTGIYETVWIVSFSWPAVVSTYTNWLNDNETIRWLHSSPDSGLADRLIQCRSKYNCLGEHISADTTGYRTTQHTSNSWTYFDQASSPPTPAWTREHRFLDPNRDCTTIELVGDS